VRALVALGAVAAIAAGLAAFASRRAPLGSDLAQNRVLVVVGALTRRYGIALPGNGFSSFILGVTAYAILDRGWAFGILLARWQCSRATSRCAVCRWRSARQRRAPHAGRGRCGARLCAPRWGHGCPGAGRGQPRAPGRGLVLLPCVVNSTFYVELALGRSLAWVDAALTARWKPSCTPARRVWHSRASRSCTRGSTRAHSS